MLKGKDSPCFIDRIGERGVSLEGYVMEIVDYPNNKNISVLFIDNIVETTIRNKEYKEFKSGRIKNPYHLSVYGVGYFGQGIYKSYNNGAITEYYLRWVSMLSRCYNEKYTKSITAYKGCFVDERWHNFQNFAQWYKENYNPETMQGWQLDKDILVKGNKIYSPKTCCFVPTEINNAFANSLITNRKLPLGVTFNKKLNKYIAATSRKHICTAFTAEEAFSEYKKVKEERIKELAEKWKGKITEEAYNALMARTVEITD